MYYLYTIVQFATTFPLREQPMYQNNFCHDVPRHCTTGGDRTRKIFYRPEGFYLPHYVTIAKQSVMLFIEQPQDLQSSLGEMLSNIVCCSLEYIFTILKFLQDTIKLLSVIRVHFTGASIRNLSGNFNSKFQLRYLLYTLYTFMILSMLASQRQT